MKRCQRCGAVRPADRIVLHVYLRHRAWWTERYGPRPPEVDAPNTNP